MVIPDSFDRNDPKSTSYTGILTNCDDWLGAKLRENEILNIGPGRVKDHKDFLEEEASVNI